MLKRYRVVKKPSWWTRIFTTSLPQFLYWDNDLETFEVSGYGVAKKHKWIFDKEEIDQMKKDYPDIENEFLIREENVYEL